MELYDVLKEYETIRSMQVKRTGKEKGDSQNHPKPKKSSKAHAKQCLERLV